MLIKNEITYKLFTYKSYMYIYLNLRKQMKNSEENYSRKIEILETIQLCAEKNDLRVI